MSATTIQCKPCWVRTRARSQPKHDSRCEGYGWDEALRASVQEGGNPAPVLQPPERDLGQVAALVVLDGYAARLPRLASSHAAGAGCPGKVAAPVVSLASPSIIRARVLCRPIASSGTERLPQAMVPGRVAPPQAIAIEKDNAALDPPPLSRFAGKPVPDNGISNARLATADGKEGLRPRHLCVGQPERVRIGQPSCGACIMPQAEDGWDLSPARHRGSVSPTPALAGTQRSRWRPASRCG